MSRQFSNFGDTTVAGLRSQGLSEPVGIRLQKVGSAVLGSAATLEDPVAIAPIASSLQIGDGSMVEGNSGSSNAIFSVTLTGSSDQIVTVDYATADGTALAGIDYTASSGQLSFTPGQTTQTITVPILGDLQGEPRETFFVNLTAPVNATLSDGQAVGTILNDDPFPLPDIALTPYATGLANPTDIVSAEDGSDRLFVLESAGQIRIVQNGTVLPQPFLDIRDRVKSGGEEGLLSLAFPPDYASKGYFYVYYTNRSGNIVIARYQLTSDSNVANSASEQIVLTIPHPTFTNHNGGKLAFGPDGYLYISVGDGGGGGDPNNNAQNPASLLGKILRLDVETPGTAPYIIPSTNPFLAAADPSDRYRDEIWALGLRNPWRISFDRQTGDLYIADVGQNAREEVNFQPASSLGGENYGWKVLEGTLPFSPGDSTGFVPPILEYDHSQGQSITGGYVYRGTEFQALQEAYLYADFSSGRIWGTRRTPTDTWETRLLLDSPYNISTFGQDRSGNLYIADYFGGSLYKIAAPATPP